MPSGDCGAVLPCRAVPRPYGPLGCGQGLARVRVRRARLRPVRVAAREGGDPHRA
jgi:hypothetical protein